MASSWFLFFSCHKDAWSNKHQILVEDLCVEKFHIKMVKKKRSNIIYYEFYG